MRHEERWQLAQDMTARLTTRYPGEVVLGGVYGSTAHGTDTEWSDLELLFVVREGSRIEGRYFLFRGTAVGYRAITQPALEEILTRPLAQWPFYMGVLSVLQVLHGDPEQVREWLRLGQATPLERFRALLEAELPALVFESYGRVLSCRERGNRMDIGHAVIEVLYEMNRALCLLNRRWVTHDYYEGFVEAFGFPLLPEGYRDLVPTLWSAREIEEIVPVAERLVGNFVRLLAQAGIPLADHQSLDAVPL